MAAAQMSREGLKAMAVSLFIALLRSQTRKTSSETDDLIGVQNLPGVEQMQNQSLPNTIPIGLLELNANGTVLYFKPDRESSSNWSAAEVIGRNLFTDIAPIAEDAEFLDRIKAFRRGGAPAESFHFTFGVNQNYLSVKVLMARIHEQSALGSAESVLIHIRPQAGRMAA